MIALHHKYKRKIKNALGTRRSLPISRWLEAGRGGGSGWVGGPCRGGREGASQPYVNKRASTGCVQEKFKRRVSRHTYPCTTAVQDSSFALGVLRAHFFIESVLLLYVVVVAVQRYSSSVSMPRLSQRGTSKE